MPEINKYSPYVTRYKNVPAGGTGTYEELFSPILVIEPPRDMVFLIDPREKLVLKLYDAASNEFPDSTKLRFSLKGAGAEAMPIPIGYAVYGPWKRIPYVDQIDNRKNANLVVVFPSFGQKPFAIREGEKLLVEVSATVQIDWDSTDPGQSLFAINLDMLTLAEAQRWALLMQARLRQRLAQVGQPTPQPVPPRRF